MKPRCSVFCAVSLDGYLARKDHSLDWLTGGDPDSAPPADSGYDAFMDSVDYVILGRNTFDVVLGMMKDGPWYYRKPVYVLTSRPLDLPDALKGKVESGRHTPAELVALMEGRGARRLYIDGGKTVTDFLRAGLIDDITLGQIAVLIGSGIRLFGDLPGDIRLKIDRSFVQQDGSAVQTTYTVVR